MTRNLYTYTYLDSNGNKILYDNNVNSICHYSTSGESWDKTGGFKSSWYKEIDYPNDGFLGPSLSSNMWEFFDFRGTVSGIVSNGLHLSISGTDSRGGISSNGVWLLSGDFDIMAFLDENSYYNEYRGTTAAGMSVSVSDSYRCRISKFFDGEEIFYKSQKVEDNDLKYYGWFDNGDGVDLSDNDITCFRIKRDGDVIRSYVGDGGSFVEVGTYISGTLWSGDVYVELELETDQENIFRSTFSGFTCSGVVVPSGIFYNQYRGVNREFPDSVLILSDDEGMSIVDDSDMSLWMRFKYGLNLFDNNNSPVISADNGKIYFTTSSGLHCVDFIEDKLKKYTKDYTATSYSNIAARNMELSYENGSASGFVVGNEVNSVSAKTIDGNSFVAVATTSGVGVRINDSISKTHITSISTDSIRLFDNRYMVWSEYDSGYSVGRLAVKDNVVSLVSSIPASFTYSSYYDLNTTPSITSLHINNIHTYYDGVFRVLSCCDSCMDYIDGTASCSFGPENVTNPFFDGEFNSYVGIYWTRSPSTKGFNEFDVYRTSSWSSIEDGFSVCFSMMPGRYTFLGDYDEIYQDIELISTSFVLYDLKFDKPATTESGLIGLDVLVDSTVVHSYTDTVSFDKRNIVLDLRNYSGSHTIRFRIKSYYTGDSINTYKFYLSNIHTNESIADYNIIPTTSSVFLDGYILYGVSEKKLFFSTESGYGSIDIGSKSLDYFYNVDDFVPFSSILSISFEEEVGV